MVGQFDKDFDLLVEFLNSKVDDRSLAIVFASYAEKYLGELIKYRLPGLNHNLREKLFNPSGLLGSFSARIDIGQSLKTINADSAHDLKLIASIRNRFAHDLSITSFDDVEISKRIDKLRMQPKFDNGASEGQNKFSERWTAWDYRKKFEWVGFTMCASLHNPLNAIRRIYEDAGKN